MKARRITAMSLSLFALAAVLGLNARNASAVNPQPLPPVAQYFPTVGLTSGQVARISVSNVVTAPGALCAQLPPEEVSLTFFNPDGSSLRDPATGAPFEATLTLAPCGSAFVDLDADLFLTSAAATDGRLEIRVVCITKPVEVPGASSEHTDAAEASASARPQSASSASAQARPPVIAGIEVFDKATGRTSIHLDSIIAILIG